MEMANYVDKGQYRGQQQFPTHYHLNLRSHENFSYAKNNNVLQAPQGFNGTGNAKTSYLEDLMIDLVKESRSRTTTLENSVQAIANTVQTKGKAIQSLEVQISQISTSLHIMQKGKFPSCQKKNPKEECNAITLRSGKELNKSNFHLPPHNHMMSLHKRKLRPTWRMHQQEKCVRVAALNLLVL